MNQEGKRKIDLNQIYEGHLKGDLNPEAWDVETTDEEFQKFCKIIKGTKDLKDTPYFEKIIKSRINLVFVGHVDAGKSTMAGRLLYEVGIVTETDLSKHKEESSALGKGTFEFAYSLDTLKAEREAGITIESNCKEFATPTKYITIVDAPGHEDFVKNCIRGISQADVALLVVSAEKGVQPQTKEHLSILKTMGIKKLIVAVNKMSLVNYSQESFQKVVAEVSELTSFPESPFKFDKNNLVFIPTDAYNGDNLVNKPPQLDWWKGPSLIKLFDRIPAPKRDTDKPFLMIISKVEKIPGIGVVPVGLIYSGEIKAGEKVIIKPSQYTEMVKSVEEHHRHLTEAAAGQNVGISIRGVTKNVVTSGSVISHLNNAPVLVSKFKAMVNIGEDHLHPLFEGSNVVVHVAAQNVTCKIEKVIDVFKRGEDGQTYRVEQEEGRKRQIEPCQYGLILLSAIKPLIIACDATKWPTKIITFNMRDSGKTIGSGKCIEIIEKAQSEL